MLIKKFKNKNLSQLTLHILIDEKIAAIFSEQTQNVLKHKITILTHIY